LHERLGVWAFWLWITGFLLAFIPLYALGLMGMTRRLYQVDPVYAPMLMVAAVGAFVIAVAIFTQVLQVVVSVKKRRSLTTNEDPWNGRTLEWATATPVPEYNFAAIPHVHGRDAWWMHKQGHPLFGAKETHVAMPRNSSIGILCSVSSFVLGFALIWHIWWLAAAAFVFIICIFVVRSFAHTIERTVAIV
jgi:cytochrome o ubiquinol oxidase subunit 1